MGRVKKEVLNKRRELLLNLVVEEYLYTGNPVSSASLVEKYSLNVSPATVRNDFAYLEESGYIYQPHFSAGRVPTDVGIRHYVKTVLDKHLLTEEERKAVENLLASFSGELENIYLAALKALAQLTSCFGVAVASPAKKPEIRHLDLVDLGGGRLLLLVVDEGGNVYQRKIEIGALISPQVVNYVLQLLRENLINAEFSKIESMSSLTSPAVHPSVECAYLYNRTVAELKNMYREHTESAKIYKSRIEEAHLEEMIESKELLKKFASLLESEVYFVKLAQEALSENKVVVKIGSENPIVSELSVIAAPYRSRWTAGIIGVVGPKRMNYFRVIGATKFISNRLSELFDQVK